MSIEDLQNKYDNFYVPRFTVGIDGEEFQESRGVISNLTVDTLLDGADRFSLTLNYLFDRETERFVDLDWGRFRTGASVEISMGYGDRLEPMFVGRINSVRPTFPSEGGPTVDVSGYSLLHDMMRGTESRSWDEQTDSFAARDVAGNYEFSELSIEETGVKQRKIKQDRESDYRFIKRLAGNNDFEFAVRLDAVYFGPPREDSSPEVTLQYGESLSSLSLELTDTRQVSEVEVRHWDPKRKTEIVGSAKLDGEDMGKKVLRRPVWSTEEATRLAEAELNTIMNGQIRGSGETLGIPEIRAGKMLEVAGIDEFSDTYYVTGATHRVGEPGYSTSFQLAPKESAV